MVTCFYHATPAEASPAAYLDSNVEGGIARAYVRWHTEQLSGNCEESELLVWTATAGFGDSVNAFSAAFQIAVQTKRLLFVEWPSVKAGLALLYPWWHFDDFLSAHPTREDAAFAQGLLVLCLKEKRLAARFRLWLAERP